MTDNEKLARWQGLENVHPTRLSNGTIVIIYNSNEIVPDYPNDDEAAMSLLDTLVEKGYLFTLKYTGENSYRWWFEIEDAKEVIVAVKYNRATRREAIVAACLELIGKEGKMTFENWMTQRYSYEYSKGEYRDHDMQAAYTAGFREASDKAATLPHRAMYDAGYEDGVQAERERCVRIADGYDSKTEYDYACYDQGKDDTASNIAEAIRRMGNERIS